MHHRKLMDLAKFGAGLVAADLVSLIWAAQAGLFPVQFLGMEFSNTVIVPGILFDIGLLIILIHYGWHIGKMPRLRENSYLVAAGVVFTLVATVHLLRLFTGTEVVIAGWIAPLWLSWFGVIATSYLAYTSFVLAGRSGKR